MTCARAFSNYGNASQYPNMVAAPGVSVYSTMPNHSGTYLGGIYGMNYAALSGTSMATPHVAGLAALIGAHAPTLTASQIVARIEDRADDVGAYRFYGHGRVNALASLDGTSAYAPPNPVDPREPNDTTSTASEAFGGAVGASTVITVPADGYLFPAGDRDLFAIEATVPGTIQASVSGVIDLELALAALDSDGVTQTIADSHGVFSGESLTYEVDTPGYPLHRCVRHLRRMGPARLLAHTDVRQGLAGPDGPDTDSRLRRLRGWDGLGVGQRQRRQVRRVGGVPAQRRDHPGRDDRTLFGRLGSLGRSGRKRADSPGAGRRRRGEPQLPSPSAR